MMQNTFPLVKNGCPVGAGTQRILIEINDVDMSALDRKTDVHEVTNEGRGHLTDSNEAMDLRIAIIQP